MQQRSCIFSETAKLYRFITGLSLSSGLYDKAWFLTSLFCLLLITGRKCQGALGQTMIEILRFKLKSHAKSDLPQE